MPRRMLSSALCFALICWACAILWLSSLGPQDLPRTAFLLWDKINHLAAFALGGWLAASALRVARPSTSNAVAIASAVLCIAIFGVLDEAVQTFTPGRTGGDFFDWIADVLGAGIGALVSLWTQRHLNGLIART